MAFGQRAASLAQDEESFSRSRNRVWTGLMNNLQGGLRSNLNTADVTIPSTRLSRNSDRYHSVLSPPRAISASHPSINSLGMMQSRYQQQKLRDWIRMHSIKLNGTFDVKETKRYYERCVGLLHTLVLKSIVTVMKDKAHMEMEAAVLPNILALDNIVVQQSAEYGEAAFFIQNEIQDSKIDSSEIKYKLMKAMGVVAYQLFMGGTGPPISSLDGTERQIAHITDQAKRPRAKDRSQGRIANAMLDSGVPYPLCRFTVDLLGGECNGDASFRNDNSFQSFNDIVADLQQMLDSPSAFLHLSVRDQCKLAIGEKMHGREIEKNIIMDIASRVSGVSTKNDALFEALAMAIHQIKKQHIIFVTGQSGVGKSRLILESTKQLQDIGWLRLGCKFDRLVHSQPLSIVAGAFNDFLKHCDAQVLAKLKESMHNEDMVLLGKHLTHLLRNDDQSQTSTLCDIQIDTERMHELFSRLLYLISSVSKKPIIFFMDDLQWADSTSIGVFLALIRSREIDALIDNKILFVGSFRDGEVDDNLEIVQMLEQLQSSSSVQVTNIPVKGFGIDTLNKVMSESLCVPSRKTRALSEIILQKTDGIIIHMIEFVQRLVTENILLHSLVKGWEWDCDTIESCPISNTVAGLFAFKMKSLSSDALLGLKICSIFGCRLDQRTIDYIQGYDGDNSVNIEAALQATVEARLIDKTEYPIVYKFAHDIVAEAAFELISADERSHMIQKLATTLIKNAFCDDFTINQEDSIIFVAVDLINRIGHCNVTDSKARIIYASMNNKAATKALSVPDFNSAVKYSENGLLFLEENSWESQHDLTLQLHASSVCALYSNKKSDQEHLQERIASVFMHAKNLEEEFKTRLIWIELLSTSSMQKAVDECHKLLKRLGDPLDITKSEFSHVCYEIERVKKDFLAKETHRLMPARMNDSNRTKAMKVLSFLAVFYHYQRSIIGGIVIARMVELSIRFGPCEESIFGLASFSYCVLSFLGDIDEACSCTRLALSLSSKSGHHNINMRLPMVYCAIYGLVLIFKEPIQATLDPLLIACRSAFDYGNKFFAAANARVYVMRSYLSGKKIDVLLSEVEMLAEKCAQHGQIPFIKQTLTPAHNVLRDLAGLEPKALSPLEEFVENNILRKSNETYQLIFELQLLLDITHSFFLRDFDKAQQLAEVLVDAYEKGNQQYAFNRIICDFYVGLVACHFGRQTEDTSWLLKAKQSLKKVESVLIHSVWNFENKYQLLKAECHYTAGEISEAAKCYEESNNSARDHKFIHEHALCCEMAGHFYKDQGDQTKSQLMFNKAKDAYTEWGAVKKAETVNCID